MLASLILLVIGLGVILFSAELFTNGIEWLGRKLRLGEGAVGSVLAAVGTALPETLVPMVAVLIRRGDEAKHVGVGAILGAPLMLSTLAMCVTGIAVLAYRKRRRRQRLSISRHVLSRDLGFFLLLYPVAAAAGFFPPSHWRLFFCLALVIGYVYYVYLNFRESAEHHGELAPLRLHVVAGLTLMPRAGEDRHAMRRRRQALHEAHPHLLAVVAQVVVAVGGIVAGAYLFVDGVQSAARLIGVAPLVLSLIITPIATELPEKFNSVLWVRQGKDTLALGNITGAMVFQSTFPTAVGITWTDWNLFHQRAGEWSPDGIISVVVALVAACVVLLTARRPQGPEGEMRTSLNAWVLVGMVGLYAVFLTAAFVW